MNDETQKPKNVNPWLLLIELRLKRYFRERKRNKLIKSGLAESPLTLEKVQDMTFNVSLGNRAAVSAKLEEFGVYRVSDLDPKHYAEFVGFLKTLKTKYPRN